MLRIDKRLREVINNIEGDTLADIGCDHGKVGVISLSEGRVKKVIASDISQPSLNKAKKLAEDFGLEHYHCRLSDGFNAYVDNEVDVCVIAGMGAKEIIKILSTQPKGIVKYVLLAHKDEEQLREYLTQNNCLISKDYVIHCKGHFYHLIVACQGSQKLNLSQKLLGNSTLDNKDFEMYLEYIFDKYNHLMQRQTQEQSKADIALKLQIVQDKLLEVKNAKS